MIKNVYWSSCEVPSVKVVVRAHIQYFIKDIVKYLDTEQTHPPVINSLRTPEFIYLQMILL